MDATGNAPIDDGMASALAASADAAPRVQAALTEAQSWVGGEVFAVGVGAADDGAAAIVVLAGPTAQVPDSVNGIPVLVQRSGPVQAQEHRTDPDRVDDSEA